jgi:hypothetical protein
MWQKYENVIFILLTQSLFRRCLCDPHISVRSTGKRETTENLFFLASLLFAVYLNPHHPSFIYDIPPISLCPSYLISLHRRMHKVLASTLKYAEYRAVSGVLDWFLTVGRRQTLDRLLTV